MTTYYFWIAILSISIYVIAVDKNVSDYVLLIFKLINVNIRRFFWIIHFHPKNPIGNYLIWKRSFRIAKKLQEEIKNDL